MALASFSLAAVAALASVGFAEPIPLDKLVAQKQFTLEQYAVPSKRHWWPAERMARTYQKYGASLPESISTALDQLQNGNLSTSVPVRPVKGDVEYLINVTVGNHQLALDMDTGSSDLWVFSTLQPQEQRTNRPLQRVYDPEGSKAQKLDGHSWQIRYGDMSGANGQVYLDNVCVGTVCYEKQAVEAAASVSRTFAKDGANDGLLGLAASKLNTIKPTPQKTWFDNVKDKLAKPVFTASLKRHAVGSYDFGWIDPKKYTGEINYLDVSSTRGFWSFEPTGYSIGKSQQETKATIKAIADTGTSLWYLPRPVVDAYWAQVDGAQYNSLQAGWMFPCRNEPPDFNIWIGGQRYVVPGINMNYQTISSFMCYGGLQRDTGMPFSIFGDVFLKGVFMVFEHETGKTPRVGFAQSSNLPAQSDEMVDQTGKEGDPFEFGPSEPSGQNGEGSPFGPPFGGDDEDGVIIIIPLGPNGELPPGIQLPPGLELPKPGSAPKGSGGTGILQLPPGFPSTLGAPKPAGAPAPRPAGVPVRVPASAFASAAGPAAAGPIPAKMLRKLRKA